MTTEQRIRAEKIERLRAYVAEVTGDYRKDVDLDRLVEIVEPVLEDAVVMTLAQLLRERVDRSTHGQEPTR